MHFYMFWRLNFEFVCANAERAKVDVRFWHTWTRRGDPNYRTASWRNHGARDFPRAARKLVLRNKEQQSNSPPLPQWATLSFLFRQRKILGGGLSTKIVICWEPQFRMKGCPRAGYCSRFLANLLVPIRCSIVRKAPLFRRNISPGHLPAETYQQTWDANYLT